MHDTRYSEWIYDTSKYDFVSPIKNLFGVENLEDLHEQHDELFKISADSCTSFHQRFYDKYRAGWNEMVELYDSFVRDEVAPGWASWKEPLLYQKFPTFRVHLRNNLAVGAFHNDAEFGHPLGEVNYIIPLTNSDGNASVWVESLPRKADFEPMRLRVGECIAFNGNQLTHGNKVNDTGQARVSMDFRVLPISLYAESSSVSMTLKKKFVEGEYYKRL
jgi:hypothetical protein